jgi:VanZ family protein
MRRILRPLPWAAGAWIGYWAALFIATHLPRLPRVAAPLGWDKAVHFLGYAGLAVLTCTVLLRGGRWSRGAAAAILAGLMLYGVLDELLQIPIPHRTADLFDWLCDSAGAAAGILAFRAMQRSLARRRQAARAATPVAVEQV